jgi:hypothetical protein
VHEARPAAGRLADTVTRWRRRTREHVARGDLRGLARVLTGGVRHAVRRAAPAETVLFANGLYLHRTRTGSVPSYSLRRFELPPGVERVGATRFTVDLERVTTYCGFSYAAHGWHPLVALLEEYRANPSLRYEESILCRLYERFTPATVAEAVFDGTPEDLAPLDRLPAVHGVLRSLWALDRRQVDRLAAGAPYAPVIDDPSRYMGPKSREKGAWHFAKVIRLYESVRRHGYDPGRFGGERPKGYFLVRDDDYRFVIAHAQRRLPALRVAAVRRLVATFQEHVPPVVDEADLARWSSAAGGPYPLAVAQRLFDRLFTATGAERADVLGLR